MFLLCPHVTYLMFATVLGHTREQLDDALQKIDEVADILKLKYRKYITG